MGFFDPLHFLGDERNPIKKALAGFSEPFGSGSKWSHLGSNQGPPDYESGALTN